LKAGPLAVGVRSKDAEDQLREERYRAIRAVLAFVREALRRYHAAAVSRIANPQLATLRSRLVVSSARVVNYD